MTAPAMTLAAVRKLHPCKDRIDAVAKLLPARRKLTAAEAREGGATFGDLVWLTSAVARTDKDVERRLRMWMADCAARVLHIYERDYPNDDRPRRAIEAARAYAIGEIDAAASVAASAAARAAAWDAGDAASAAARAARAAGDAARAARDAARDAAWAARDAARDAAWAARDAARDAAWAAEEAWQFDRLVAWFSDEEPEPLALIAKQEAA